MISYEDNSIITLPKSYFIRKHLTVVVISVQDPLAWELEIF